MGWATAQEEESLDTYQGPSILSRGGSSTAGERAGRLVDFQIWGDLSGVYDSDLAGLIVGPNGQLETSGADYGLNAGGGVVGSKTWRHDQLSIDYTGHIRHYAQNSFYDGTDQLLQLDWKHTISRHLRLEVHDVGGITSVSYGDFAYAPLRTTDLIGLPSNQLFDNRTMFDDLGAQLIWQKTARLSFGFGGDGFLTDYRATGLASMRGAQGRLDAVYRLSRQQKVYLTYNLIRFDYQHAFGQSTMNMYAAGYSLDIGRRWTLETQGGVYAVHTIGLIEQPLPPAIALILGQSFTIVVSDRHVYVPDGQARLTRRFSRSALDIGGAEEVSPGDGVYLTSRSRRAYVNYSVVGSRRLTFAMTAGYNSLSSIGQQNIGQYRGYLGGAGATWRINGILNGIARYDFYNYNTGISNFHQNENRVTVGIAFSTGDRPLAIW